MLEYAFWYIFVLGSAVLFTAIGVYAFRKETPMNFWSGTSLQSAEITNVTAYNRENGILWLTFSLWFWASGFSMIINGTLALIILMGAFIVGLPLMISSYKNIHRKYAINQ